MEIHVFKLPGHNDPSRHRQSQEVRRALHDALLRYHAQEALGASVATPSSTGMLGYTELLLDGGPWSCAMSACLLDNIVIKDGTINFQCTFEDFEPINGGEEPLLPEKDGESYGVVGYIGFDARGCLTVQLHVIDEPPADDDSIHGWESDLTHRGDLGRSCTLLEGGVFYGVIER